MDKNRENLLMLLETGTLKVVNTLEENQGDPSSQVWTAEVWRLGERNLNGRIYTEDLARRIVAQGLKTMAYDGHEADFTSGHDYAPAIAYCDNPRIEGGCMVVDIHFLESQETSASVRNIRELHAAGLPIGVSSVGYGSLDADGVIQEDYELVRYLDFVALPAGLVYANPKNEKSNPEPEAEHEDETVVESDPAMAEAKAKAQACFNKTLTRRRPR